MLSGLPQCFPAACQLNHQHTRDTSESYPCNETPLPPRLKYRLSLPSLTQSARIQKEAAHKICSFLKQTCWPVLPLHPQKYLRWMRTRQISSNGERKDDVLGRRGLDQSLSFQLDFSTLCAYKRYACEHLVKVCLWPIKQRRSHVLMFHSHTFRNPAKRVVGRSKVENFHSVTL